eukprot:6128690-Pyramimonas_sp.AAC.1
MTGGKYVMLIMLMYVDVTTNNILVPENSPSHNLFRRIGLWGYRPIRPQGYKAMGLQGCRAIGLQD